MFGSAPTVFTFIISKCAVAAEAPGLLTRLAKALLKEGESTSAVDNALAIEAELKERVALIREEAAKAGASARSIVEAILKDRPGPNEGRAAAGAGGEGVDDASLSSRAIEAAVLRSAFRALAVAVRNAGCSTRLEKITALACGFDGKCPIAMRALCSKKRISRHPTLLQLFDLRGYVPDYLSWTLIADPSGIVPARLLEFSIRGQLKPNGQYDPRGQKFFEQITTFDFASADWVNSPGGVLALFRLRQGCAFGEGVVQADDVFTVPAVVVELGEYIHQILVALGAEDVVPNPAVNGYTFRAWNEKYLAHLALAHGMHTRELQLKHLTHCHTLYQTALRTIGRLFQDIVFGVAPAERSLQGGLLRADEEPMNKLIAQAKRREAVSELVAELVDFVPGLQEKAQAGSSAADAARPFEIPKRSEAKGENRAAKRPAPPDSSPSRRVRSTPGPSAGVTPGSLLAAHQWLSSGKELYISGQVWNIPGLARKLNVQVGSKCWPWILSRKSEANRPGTCKDFGKPGHKSAYDSAHTVQPAPDFASLSADPTLCRYPTDGEQASLHARMEAAGIPTTYLRPPHPQGTSPGAKGRGAKGSKGRGRGKGERGRGGRGGDTVDENMVEEIIAGEAEVALEQRLIAVGDCLAPLGLAAGDDEKHLHRVSLPASYATQRGLLPPPLRALAVRLAPKRMVVDCGGQGQCGPNSVAFLLGHLNLFEGDGAALRERVATYLSDAGARERLTILKWRADPGRRLTLGELMVESMRAWPDSFRQGQEASTQAWCDIIRQPEAWTDLAFLLGCVDIFSVTCVLTGVNDLGEVRPMLSLEPRAGKQAIAVMEIGCWLNRHFVAIVEVSRADSSSEGLRVLVPAGEADKVAGEMAEWRSFDWPLRSPAEFRRLLECKFIRPTVLVAMEFSGAVRTAVEAAGARAISVDFRPCEAGGMHYQGDVRDVAHLQHWTRAFFHPYCFQHHRWDKDCLPNKIRDGRAYWGSAAVLWCFAFPFADAVCVEQPDTITADFIDLGAVPGGAVREFTTDRCGDREKKFVRLSTRNLEVSDLGVSPAKKDPIRSQFLFKDADERDRARSSWKCFPATCRMLASAPLAVEGRAPPVDFAALICLFAAAWGASGKPVPVGYANEDGLPPDEESRKYQSTRGPGDGRMIQAEAPPVNGRPALAVQGGRLSTACPLPADETMEEVETSAREDTVDFGSAGAMPPEDKVLELAAVTKLTAMVVFVAVLVQPLILAHVSGMHVLGLRMPPNAGRPAAMKQVQAWVENAVSGVPPLAFLVGEYAGGARLFAVPVDLAPVEKDICRTATHRRRALGTGATLLWCTLAALAGTPAQDVAARSVLATQAFIKPIEVLADAARVVGTGDPVSFQTGRVHSTSLIQRPLLDREESPTAWKVLTRAAASDHTLQHLLLTASRGVLEGWAEVIRPLPVTEIPAHLLANLPDFSDHRLDRVALPLVPPFPELAWSPLPPRQPTPVGAPVCPRAGDILSEAAGRRVDDWVSALRTDMLDIKRQLQEGVPADDIARDFRPKPIAVGQSELSAWARGIVWDCRQSCCEPLKFDAIPESGLNRPLMRQLWHKVPDQALLSYLLEGVRLEADVELQIVLVPHLTSLPLGFASVEKEIRRLQSLTWYDFFHDLPFLPMYINGQGAVARKLEPDRFRRSTEGGGPRVPTYDEGGLKAISINEASHIHHVPRHFLDDHRPEFVDWLRQLPLWPAYSALKAGKEVEHPIEDAGGRRFTKWPREVKPTVAELLLMLAVLSRAADALGEPVYVFGDDIKDYFNQLAIATPDLWKLGIIFLSQPRDEAVFSAHPKGEGRGEGLIVVSEKRLGFGTHGASNVAQRFSNAILDRFRDVMDEAEDKVAPSPSQQAWQRMRAGVGEEQCHTTRRWASNTEGGVRVCPQGRLYGALMYTDDPIFVVVGSQRALRALAAWRQVTEELGLIMAIPEKRTLGSWAKWLGVIVFASLGVVVIPRDKLLRARSVITRVLRGGCEFHVYRSLCGLLEHFRGVNLTGRNVMHGLYQPHGPFGASRFGPHGWVWCDELITKQLQRWLALVVSSAGVSAKRAVERKELEPSPRLTVILDSDACSGDEAMAGIGGYCHGLYWYWPVPPEDSARMHITLLEFLGVCFNILMFEHMITPGSVGAITGLLRTDALTAALTLPRESQRSSALIHAYQWMRVRPEWQRFSPMLSVQHLYGDANVMADPVSRARWEEFHRRCAQIGVSPQRIAVCPAARELYLACADFASERPLAGEMGFSFADLTCGAFKITRTAEESPRARSAWPWPGSGSMTTEDSQGSVEQASRHPKHMLLGASRSQISHDPPQSPLWVEMRPSVMGLAMPPQAPTPRRLTQSALGRASKAYAKSKVASFTEGGGDMAFSAPLAALERMAEAIDDGLLYGINANTAVKDERAWEAWEAVCAAHGTSPLRTAADARAHPERNSHLLAALMMHAFAICRPRTRGAAFIKPRSALAYPLAMVRIFTRWGVPMPPYKMLKASLSHLSRLYLAYHGPHSLAPRRAEPMKYSMVLAMNAIAEGATVGKLIWSDANHDVFMFKRLNLIMWPTAFRLGEMVKHTSGELMYLTRSCLTWSLSGVIVAHPSRAQLLEMRKGDFARLAPARSKPDQWGEIHCPFPVVLTYADEPGNAACALRDVEVRFACVGAERETLPLFMDASRSAYSHSFLDRLLKMALTTCFGAKVASLFTWHSYRSGLATALHAAKVDDGMVQLICRWMCPESLHVYRRMGTQEHEQLIRKAMTARVDLIQSVNVPKVVGDEGYAALVESIVDGRGATEQREYEKALQSILKEMREDDTPAPAAHAPSRRRPRASPPTRPSTSRPAPLIGTSLPSEGVASPGRALPPTLDSYDTYFHRPSKRRQPTARAPTGGM